MTILLSLALRGARSQAINAALGAGALIKIYSGSIPASPDAAATGVLLSTLTGNAGGFGTVTTNGVDAVNVSAGGSGYTSAPAVSFTGGSGSGATAIAVVQGGVVMSVVMTAPGTGYTSAPAVAFTGGAGSGAAATSGVGPALVASPITQDSNAAQSGTPGYARLTTSAGVAVIDVDVSAASGTAAMILTPNVVVAGAGVQVSNFLLFE